MPRFLADEDFNNRIVRGIRRRSEDIDIVRVHEVGLISEPDTEVLKWAAAQDRIVLTHDAATMIDFAYERIREGRKLSGLIVVSQFAPIGKVIDDIQLVAADEVFELIDQVIYLPFKDL
jgi:predicted nuclease of predicted toxin-antitoxin system